MENSASAGKLLSPGRITRKATNGKRTVLIVYRPFLLWAGLLTRSLQRPKVSL
jgi:hypothetical protein